MGPLTTPSSEAQNCTPLPASAARVLEVSRSGGQVSWYLRRLLLVAWRFSVLLFERGSRFLSGYDTS